MQSWIIGGTSGIGRSIVTMMKARGISALALSNDESEGVRMQQEGYAFAPLDLSKGASEIEATVRHLADTTGVPAYLFLSAAITQALTVTDTPPELWDVLARVNLLGTISVANTMACLWRERPDEMPWRRHIVFLGSVNAMRPLPSQGAYSVMKAGLHAYARCLANDLAHDQVRVNVIAPGAIWTAMNQRLLDGADHDQERYEVAHSALVPRFGEAEEIAQVAAWMALDSPPFVMAAELVVDGGYTAKR